VPGVFWIKRVSQLAIHRIWAALGLQLFLAIGALTSLLAMITNGEHKFVDMVLLICTGIVVLFAKADFDAGRVESGEGVRTFYAALLCCLCVVTVMTGVNRFRVFTIGPYFEPANNRQVRTALFPHLRTGDYFVRVLKDLDQVAAERPAGPIFFGPRMEFGYAALRIASAKHMPILWDPGTMFARSKEAALLEEWRRQRFATLIFLKNDYTYYSSEFMATLAELYNTDQRFPELTVLRLK
jgi:hypothetical protein